MHRIQTVVICFICILTIMSSCNSELRFERLDDISQLIKGIDSDSFNIKKEVFIIHGYSDTEENEQAIDSFVCQLVYPDYKSYTDYWVTFYKASSKTNPEAIRNDHEWNLYSMYHDYLWSYTFSDKYGFRSKKKVKNIKNRKFFNKDLDCWSKE